MTAPAAPALAAPAEAARLLRDLELRALLVDHLGWAPAAAHVRHVRVDGKVYPLAPLARQGPARALLYTVPPGEAIPDYAVRRRIRERIGPLPLLVFADPLRTDQVWQWTQRTPGRAPLGREAHHCAGETGEPLLDRWLQRTPPPLSRSRTRRAEVEPLLVRALLREARRRAPRALPTDVVAEVLDAPRPAHALQRLIQAADDVRLLRTVWHTLAGCTVLDPECGRGERLLLVAELLEPLYQACLERMYIWCAELDRARIGHRPERLGDFRRLLARARQGGTTTGESAWIRWAVMHNNLFGMEPQPKRLQHCRRIAERLADGMEAPAVAAIRATAARHFRLGPWSAAVLRPADAHRLLPSLSAAHTQLDALREEADLLHRARQLLLSATIPEPDARALDARHDALLQQLAALDRRADPTERSFHLWAEFPGTARRGGFTVVLTSTGGDPGAAAEPPRRAPHPASVREPREPYAAAQPGTLSQGAPSYPPHLQGLLLDYAPEQITTWGNEQLLRLPLLGLFCSSRPTGTLVLWALDAARSLRDAGVPVIGGFQTPVERECLELLLRGKQPVVLCPARGIDNPRLPTAWNRAVSEGRLLLVSPFRGTVRRPTTRLAETRNRFAAALATALLAVHAPAGSRTHALAGTALGWGKPVFAPHDAANRDLVLLGARPSSLLHELYPSFHPPRLDTPGTAE